jgi:hypothetical protein
MDDSILELLSSHKIYTKTAEMAMRDPSKIHS